MSSKVRFIAVLSVVLGITVFTTASFAQDDKTKTTTPSTTDQVRKGRPGPFGPGQNGPMGPRGRMMGPMGKFGGPGAFGRGRMGAGFRGITLTDAQKEQIKSIREANKPDKAVGEELRAIMQARRDGTITDAQKARVKELHEQAGAKAKSVHEQILNVLTADQRATIEKQHQEMKQRREEMKGKFDEMRKRFDERRKNRQATPPATTAKPADKKPTDH